ncbi:hypothetical protein ACFXDI_43875 [Streptomyces mirabilis]|uniref:ATP-dependent DNA ligase n=1 Tax=Streptomyces mirabilis TaxID=68239 RepID=UPI00369BB1FC
MQSSRSLWSGQRRRTTVTTACRWRTGDGVRLQARSGRDVTAAWGDLALAGHHLPAGTVLDGEAVITTEDGRISFEAAQARATSSPTRARRLAAQRPAHYIAFDALQLPSPNGDIRARPYSERRAALQSDVQDAPADHRARPSGLCQRLARVAGRILGTGCVVSDHYPCRAWATKGRSQIPRAADGQVRGGWGRRPRCEGATWPGQPVLGGDPARHIRRVGPPTAAGPSARRRRRPGRTGDGASGGQSAVQSPAECAGGDGHPGCARTAGDAVEGPLPLRPTQPTLKLRQLHGFTRRTHARGEAGREPDLAGDRPARPGAAGLDADARPQWNPAPARRDSRAVSIPTISPQQRNGPPEEPTDRHARSRLVIHRCGPRWSLGVRVMNQYEPVVAINMWGSSPMWPQATA